MTIAVVVARDRRTDAAQAEATGNLARVRDDAAVGFENLSRIMCELAR